MTKIPSRVEEKEDVQKLGNPNRYFATNKPKVRRWRPNPRYSVLQRAGYLQSRAEGNMCYWRAASGYPVLLSASAVMHKTRARKRIWLLAKSLESSSS